MRIQDLGNMQGRTSIGSEAACFKVRLIGDLVVNLQDSLAGEFEDDAIFLEITQDETGGRKITWEGNVLWPGAVEPVLSSSAGAKDLLNFQWYGSRFILVNAVFDLNA